jgi:hypothetical protein
MKKRSKKVLLLASFINVLCLIIFTPVAHSKDFTIRVPIELNISSEIDSLQVACCITSTDRCQSFDSCSGNLPENIAFMGASLTLSGGHYSGTVVLSADAFPGKDRLAAKKYYCGLSRYHKAGGGYGNYTGPIDMSKSPKEDTCGNIP